ncbi:MAG: O-antigen ligase family protein, partial [Clostridia bacterium]|nr:O-antigen ligase family protein [Clostridia bacterium]
NPNVYGEYLVMVIPLAIAMLFTQKAAKDRFVCTVMTAAALLALVYTQSRGAWLAFIFSMAIYLLIRTGRTLVVYILGVFSIPVLPFILPASIVSRFMSIGNLGDSSTSYRVSIWRAATDMIGDNFASGIGIGTTAFSKVYPSYSLAGIEAAPHSHQLFFQIAIEMGIFALIAFFAIIFILIRKNSSGLIMHSNRNSYTLVSSAALCGIIAMMVQGLTDYVWYNYRVFGMFWIVMGLCVATLRCADNEKTKERM